MKVCVFGAGAIGGHIAARLALAGAEVSLVARGAHLAAIQADGLTFHAPDATHHSRPRASADPAELGPQDAVIVTVKAPSLPSVAAGIAPLLGPDTPVAFVMNGIPWWYFDGIGGALDGHRLPALDPDEALRRAIGIPRSIGGVIYSACEVVAPGVVKSAHGNIRLYLGEPDNRLTPRVEALVAFLRAGGWAAEASTDIRTEVWLKLIGNLASGPLCVLTRSTIGAAFADPTLGATARTMAEEARAIGLALGCRIGQDAVDRVAKMTMSHKPSILQDLELGRPMEVEALWNAPLELARLGGTPTPVSDLVIALARHAARTAGLYAPPAPA
jgi:2-dehydropantoate 2-reductase